MIKRVILVIVGFVVVVAVLAVIKVKQIQAAIAMGASMAPPPPAVSTTVAEQDLWPRHLFAVGTLEAVQGVTVTAQLDGQVTDIEFQSGTTIEGGSLLAKQETSTDAAQLRSAEARARLAELQLQRNRDLRESNSISQSDLDAAEAEAASALAEVEAVKAAMEMKRIRAPFSGRLGIRQVNVGDYLRAGDPVVALESLDPIYVNFSLPQQDLSQVRLGQEVRVEVDTFPGETFTGRITAVNPRIDPRTRALQVQAELPNPDSLLLPGMFVRANVALPNPDQLVTLPITAVAFTTFGDSVYVVEKTEDGNAVAKQVAVRTAGRRGNQVAIAEGVQPGMEIVTSGQMKLRNNSPIRINNSIELPSGATAQVEER